MAQMYEFEEVGRLPLPGDNVAIATRRLEAGTTIRYGDRSFGLDHTIMEGHRFAIEPIEAGELLLSWELPFGAATCPIDPGAYVCNVGMLEALEIRSLDFALPDGPNFEDRIESYQLDDASYRAGEQVETYAEGGSFSGYSRGPDRGVGTRNYIVILGTSSQAATYARLLAERMREAAKLAPLDGVVAIAHTEGGGLEAPNNRELLLRTLAGFMVHPNVGAVLAVDRGTEAVTNQMLKDYMAVNRYPLDQVVHHFMTLGGNLEAHLVEGEKLIGEWFEGASRARREEHALNHLKIALQCGGSDAFSGISGNPLVSWVAREVIRYGGAANLAETDELIGAESYMLQNVRDVETAQKFLHMIERFKERVSWHGASAEGNPSGGNKFRGLYNIVLKSIGAAMKRHPEVRLDYAIDYGERILEPGYYFMDSPGNDLESIAGQVATGCNMIFFVTGNGSITNFPFVPTIKVVTTSQRYELLSADMDFNAGAYQDGTPMDKLGQSLFERTLEVASGNRSRGERAGHSQVSIWRNWRQTDSSNLESLMEAEIPSGEGLAIQAETGPDLRLATLRTDRGHATDQCALILPTSLCAGQIARMSAERLNAKGLGSAQGISRFVALVHTEGCGLSSSGAVEQAHLRTMMGYLTHPLVRRVLLLEHGCEKTHNDYYRNEIESLGLDLDHFGWASVQLDGGIEKVMDRVEEWFSTALVGAEAPELEEVGLEGLHLGMYTTGPLAENVADYLARLTRWIVGAGGTVVVPENAELLSTPTYAQGVLGKLPARATLAYGQCWERTGFYIMETPSDHWVETLTGLGATGVEMVLAHVGSHPLQGHPLVPLLQVAQGDATTVPYARDLDLLLESAHSSAWSEQVLHLLLRAGSRQHVPRAVEQRNIDFQLTRGLLGVST